jgi:hypothetical protein
MIVVQPNGFGKNKGALRPFIILRKIAMILNRTRQRNIS